MVLGDLSFFSKCVVLSGRESVSHLKLRSTGLNSRIQPDAVSRFGSVSKVRETILPRLPKLHLDCSLTLGGLNPLLQLDVCSPLVG